MANKSYYQTKTGIVGNGLQTEMKSGRELKLKILVFVAIATMSVISQASILFPLGILLKVS